MSEYIFETEFNTIIYQKEDANFKEFEGCTFNRCDFSGCTFVAVTFIDCVFNDCNFDGAKINYAAFRTVSFNNCTIREVNFVMCDKLIFEIHFKDSILDFSKFYTLKIKGTTFTNCSIIAVDFMKTDLTEVIFDRCDLYRAEFEQAIANKCNFLTSFNYTIDPSKTKLKKAVFSLNEVKGLLHRHEIIVL